MLSRSQFAYYPCA